MHKRNAADNGINAVRTGHPKQQLSGLVPQTAQPMINYDKNHSHRSPEFNISSFAARSGDSIYQSM